MMRCPKFHGWYTDEYASSCPWCVEEDDERFMLEQEMVEESINSFLDRPDDWFAAYLNVVLARGGYTYIIAAKAFAISRGWKP